MIKYETEILEAFDLLGKKPRGSQLEQISQIIVSFKDDQYDNVILNASTGAGKSIIGAVVAEVMHRLDPLILGDKPGQASFILVGTNILTEQYSQTFNKIKDFLLVKGVSNYPCELMSTSLEPKTGEECCRTDIVKSQQKELIELVDKFCEKCELAINRKERRYCKHMITNYSFYFIDRLYVEQYQPRTITVWDEAHTINDIFSEHCAIFISEKRLDLYAEEIAKDLDCPLVEVFNRIKKVKNGIVKEEINNGNYLEYLSDLSFIYKSASEQADNKLESMNMSLDLKHYSKIKKIGKKYSDLNCKIGDFFKYEFEHIFELVKDKNEFSIKPIFVGNMFNQLINSRYNLFMSATVSEEMLSQSLGLHRANTKFIKLTPTFPKENKTVIFHGVEKLNYETMKNPKVIERLGEICNTISNRHAEILESGIILTPSFDVTVSISKAVKGIKVFEHKRGEKLAVLVKAFKSYKKPSVLISPSLWEGVDLSDDHSRYQIFVKTPFASLADKRTKYIADYHKDMYTLSTILKLVQGCGRSVRSEEDWATTYMLDQMSAWTWENKLNVWRNEFKEIYKSFS
jgi:ATP-dependent DNA helicase DinG